MMISHWIPMPWNSLVLDNYKIKKKKMVGRYKQEWHLPVEQSLAKLYIPTAKLQITMSFFQKNLKFKTKKGIS